MINIVDTRCPPETEERFDRWNSEKHVPDLLEFKGVKGVTRYKMVNHSGQVSAKEYPTFVTVYEFDSLRGLPRV